MKDVHRHKKWNISLRSQRLLRVLLQENPKLEEAINTSDKYIEFFEKLRTWGEEYIKSNPVAHQFYTYENTGRDAFEKLAWRDFAAIRILDYLDNSDKTYNDLNLRGKEIINHPFKLLWLAAKKGTGGAQPAFFHDMIELFRQLSGKSEHIIPGKEKVTEWMDRHPSGLDPKIIKIREENRDRILKVIIDRIDKGEINDAKFKFEPGISQKKKFKIALKWWGDHLFHLRFAIRSPEMLNEMMAFSLHDETIKMLDEASEVGIPFFVNPYYLSLLNVRVPLFALGADLAIRAYVFYSRQLIDEFGHIVAWEKEDKIIPGKPNAAGWLLPQYDNVHRRYPEVAILIPDTIGRACGGLCSSCQRMYGFQKGNLNFDLDTLRPRETWPEKLTKLMKYFEKDSQLRDILITGGDALMSTDKSLERILRAVYRMAERKILANQKRTDGNKYAEMVRIRLGTRLPVYLPQRMTPQLINILTTFKEKASKIGFKQFVIQTHFETAMEVTPEAKKEMLISAGWIVTNQQVFTAEASRRGHTAKLRQVLNDVGVLPYYTFSVKGYMENYSNFTNNARAMQEQIEEKIIGDIPEKYFEEIKTFPMNAESMIENVQKLREEAGIPFLATDRNVLNLPGVGKSLTFRTIGITKDGRRILSFEHDSTRRHSPIINKMGNVVIIESKTIHNFLDQLADMGEDPQEYMSIYGYSIGETEPRMAIYEYPGYDFEMTDEMTNLDIGD